MVTKVRRTVVERMPEKPSDPYGAIKTSMAHDTLVGDQTSYSDEKSKIDDEDQITNYQQLMVSSTKKQ